MKKIIRWSGVLAVLCALGSLDRPNAARAADILSFPPGFLWGAATAAHQVEGMNTNNDWWEWEATCHLPGCERSGLADDDYHLYEQDLALAQSIGLNSYRMSIEWARVEPSEGVFSEAELQHYRKVLEAAHRHGLKVFLTLHHFTLPLWVAHRGRGSWLDPGIAQLFGAYAQRVARELGDLVDYWLTINEPTVNMLTGYVVGQGPPGLKDFHNGPAVLTNMLKAHALAYHAIHDAVPGAQVGFAHHVRVFVPYDDWSPLDQVVTSALDDFWNHQYLRAIQTGQARFRIPFLIDSDEEIPGLAGTLDFLGVNYYTREFVKFDMSSPEKFVLPVVPGLPRNDLGWEIYPDGLYQSLMAMRQYGYPIYITENGIADAQDQYRRQFLCDHLRAVARALADGADVRSYIHWALIDNFEWSLGHAPRFGLAAVDYSTMQRTLRPSASVLTEAIAASALPESCR